MTRLRLTLACGDYDRTRALEDGTVRPPGIELTYVRLPPEEIFFRMMRHHEFHVAELSLSSYVISLEQERPPFIAIPVFPSRMFRHGAIFVHSAAGIDDPSQLRGRRIGVPEYQLTAGVWVRGILADHHSVPADSVIYFTGGQEQPGRVEKVTLELPDSFDVRRIGPGETLGAMLAAGEIDALYTPRTPSLFRQGDPRIRRLFTDVVTAERSYYEQSRIFPIMHVVVVRRDIYDACPWVARSLVAAFTDAKELAAERLADSSALSVMLPWANQHAEQARALLGTDYWSYGLPGNADVLATFLRYHRDQGLSRTERTPSELFAPEAREAAVI